ncbi:hypothetical protein CDIK_4293 [Cucumispora dikerogammari]|nr:hypothetical protein CDIK_4293 [Cucumispora dikerogammari]
MLKKHNRHQNIHSRTHNEDLRDIREDEYVNFCLSSIQMKNYKLEPEPPSHFNNKNIIKTINTITPTFKFNQEKIMDPFHVFIFHKCIDIIFDKKSIKNIIFQKYSEFIGIFIMDFVFNLHLENIKVTDNT